VVVAARDPNPIASGGLERLRAAGVDVEVGVEEHSARELNASFFHALAAERPWVTLKLALSLDAAIADAQGRSQWITGPRARRAAHLLRAGHDAIAVGIGTVLADDPSLTVRGVRAPRVAPARVVFDRGARLPLTSILVRTAREVPTLVVARDPAAERAAALRAAGVEVLEARDAAEALGALKGRGVRSLLVEGGARLAGALLGESLVDRLIIFQAPVVLGAGALNAFAAVPPAAVAGAPRWRPTERQSFGDDVMTIYARTTHAPGGAECSPA
jgi:diaminohydroxyphosphoribosylaminopyrimidine deaminase/5-amino-6-(5-phosphoribosylamino)uracil reductase